MVMIQPKKWKKDSKKLLINEMIICTVLASVRIVSEKKMKK
jgi:hypothetical protein